LIDRKKTPAEVAGIRIEGKNKWMTVIQHARCKTGFIIDDIVTEIDDVSFIGGSY
jgi:hypothetical protein